MGVLAASLTSNGPAWASYDDSPTGPRGAMSLAADTPLTVSSFYAGITYISEDVAKIPFNMFEDLGAEGHRAAPEHYLQPKLHDQPNRYQTALEFREMMTAFAMLRRYGIAEKRTPPAARPVRDDELIPLHPDLVREETLPSNGERVYQYRDPLRNFEERRLLDDQVVVLRGRGGRSVMDFARESLATAAAQERHVSNLFSRGAKPGGVILRDKPWSDPDRRNFRRALDQYAVSGQRSGRPLLLEDGMKWQDVGMKSTDAELLDSRRFSVIEACRWIRIPPHKLFELERATNNNIERQSVDYVVDSLLGWTERWEQVVMRDLIVLRDRVRFFAEHNLDGLMRGDIETRFKAYALAVQWGWMTRNEVRAKENLSPLAGLEAPLTPLNMTKKTDGSVALEYAGATLSADNPSVRGRLALLASDAAAREIRREIAAVAKASERADDPAGFAAAIDAFYGDHPERLVRALHIPEHEARRYSQAHRQAVVVGGIRATDEWLVEAAHELTNLTLHQHGQQEIAA